MSLIGYIGVTETCLFHVFLAMALSMLQGRFCPQNRDRKRQKYEKSGCKK